MARHRQIAINALPDGNIGILGRFHDGVPPHGHDAPTLGRWEEIPIAKGIAHNRIGDIVGRNGKTLYAKQG